MFRFIFNFIFFGVLFYAIYYFFPDTFTVLISWTAKLFDFIRDLFVALIEWIQRATSDITKKEPAAPTHPAAFLPFLFLIPNFMRIKD